MSNEENGAAETAHEAPTPAAKAPGGFNLDSAKVKEVSTTSEGQWMHLRHPIDEHLLYIGEGADDAGKLLDLEKAKPVRVKILFAKNRKLVEYRRSLERDATMGLNNRVLSEEQDEEINLAVLRRSIVEFENVWKGDTELNATNETHKEMFFAMADEYVIQVLKFTTALTHFFGGGSKG